MHTNPKLASQLIDAYNHVSKELSLSANEFLVYCAVVHCCTKTTLIKGTVATVAASQIKACLAMSRETIRRTLHGLENKGLIRRIDDMWIYN